MYSPAHAAGFKMALSLRLLNLVGARAMLQGLWIRTCVMHLAEDHPEQGSEFSFGHQA